LHAHGGKQAQQPVLDLARRGADQAGDDVGVDAPERPPK
jgi:hypothetical protein